MNLKLDHIGIAVKEIETVERKLSKLLGITFDKIEIVENQKSKVVFSNASPSIELIEATQDNSPDYPILKHPIKSFIDKKGEGLHHICYSVKDIKSAYHIISDSGVKIIGKCLQVGSKGRKLFFIDPNETNGILIEIIEEKL
jgi:methylmalonyl-CoA/ethylmalonyl-CoA epimerase